MDEITFEQVKMYVLTQATSTELDNLAEIYKVRRKNLGLAIGHSFQPGDAVWFDARTKGVIRGKFVRMKTKNAEVLSEEGVTWTVSPQALRRA